MSDNIENFSLIFGKKILILFILNLIVCFFSIPLGTQVKIEFKVSYYAYTYNLV